MAAIGILSAPLLMTTTSCSTDVFDPDEYDSIVKFLSPVDSVDANHTWNLTTTHSYTFTANGSHGAKELLVFTEDPTMNKKAQLVGRADISDGQQVKLTLSIPGIQEQLFAALADAAGNYYPYYKIIYYLELEDDVDLDALAKAHGGSYDIENTVIWGDYDSTYTYRVKYDFLNKELVNKNDLGGISRTAQYKITFNPDKVTLNNGDPIEMEDVVSANLSVDYSSIRIVTDPAGANVPYVLKGGKDEHGMPDGTTVATYTIPDNTKVTITYDAFVRGNGEQTITNKVTALDEEEVVEDTKDYGSASEGQGAIASFKIVKTDGYDANKKLSGVRFKIYAANDELDFGEDNDYAKSCQKGFASGVKTDLSSLF